MRKPEIDQDPTIVDVMRADPKIRRVMKLRKVIDAAVKQCEECRSESSSTMACTLAWSDTMQGLLVAQSCVARALRNTASEAKKAADQ
jgi:hypothetical protein